MGPVGAGAMSNNRLDQASRFVALQDALGFFPWLVTDFDRHLRFGRWLQTQTNPPPGEPESIADTIAELFELARSAAPWLYLIEWQTEPDPDMFGRLLVELGQLWQKLRPDPLPGSRYQLAASVINLTGTRTSLPASWEFTLPGPDGTACILRVRERYLAEESAGEALERVARKEVGRCVLPLIVLMQGGGEPGIIQRWLELAGEVRDPKWRAQLGSLALVMAELKEWHPAWKQALKEWSMRESQTVLEWQREAVVEALHKTLQTLIEQRFGALSEDIRQRIEAVSEPDKLQEAVGKVLSVQRPEELPL